MKKLLLTSALVAAFPGAILAQVETGNTNVPAFRSSNFVGMSVHAIDTDEARTLSEERAQVSDPATRSEMGWTSGDILAANRDRWNDIGDVEDVILTQDGDVRGVIVDIGGFLGLGARAVLVDFADLYLVPDETTTEALDDFLLVTTFSLPELEAMPEWSEAELSTGYAPRDGTMGAMDQTAAPQNDAADPMAGTEVAKDIGSVAGSDQQTVDNDATTERFSPVDVTSLTAEKILGAEIYDASGKSVGSVSDLVLDDQDGVSAAVVDIGGFLGMGARTVAVPIEDADFKMNAMNEELRIDTVMTREQLETLPEYSN